ncbi:efflux RND transporter periplasmic adaptor subunit [Foetidibacter luteolus]|uniref:efflux RND transporter periplasmic adaptor subunit n=1 Tax=Foetidibacter luteolus TaxID=2608880 RepID=UPI00129AC5B9|nr:efflux RND transporter periplasmic adaptor subunit [Foetidibacter luteolus]
MKKIVTDTSSSWLLISIAVAGLLSGCGPSEAKTEEKKTEKEAAPAAVEVIALEKGMLSTTYKTPGELIAFHQVDLYAKENSFVRKLYADVGSEVKAGQLLASLEAPELASRIAGAESRLKSQEAVYTASKANYDRLYETSKTPGTISPNDLDQAKARMNADLAQLEAAKAGFKEVSIIQGYLEIRAPFDAVVTARNVSGGAYVGPSGKGSEFPLFTLQEQKHLRLVVAIPELYTSYLSNQNEVNFTVKALPNERFKGKIKRLSGALDTRLRTERIELDVENNNKKLLPGMIAEVTIPLPSRDSSFVVPKTAVVNSTERLFVVRLNGGKAERVTVQKGREADGKTEIYGALQTGNHLLKTGSEEVREGTEVKNVKVVE